MSAKPVARLGDTHVCPLHSVNAIVSGSETVIVNNLPMARVGDTTACGATIITGVETVIGERMLVAYLGSETSHGGTIITGSTDTFVDDGTSSAGGGGDGFSLQQLIGGAKELINKLYKEQQELYLEYIGVQPESIEEITQHTPLKLENTEQEKGAETVRNAPATGAAVAVITAVGTKGKSVLRDPKKVAQEFGELAKEQFKKRQGMKTHSAYKDRYHGPDDIVLDKNGKLTEIEAKGTLDGNKASPTKNGKNRKQGSDEKNKQRGTHMGTKKPKIGKPSNRQGGIYTQEEIDLWEKIEDQGGRKRHIFIRADKKTGKAEVFEQDKKGNLGDKIDEFDVDE